LDSSVAALIRPGDWVLDVGANVGLIAAQLARLVGGSGRVWAIEPIPRNHRRLHQLADDNQLSQMRIVEGALSNQTGEASIRIPVDGQSGWASFTKSWDMGGSVNTPTWRLDDLITGEAGRISFIKLDVEGFEPQVLMGATQTLASMRPCVMCEFNDILLRDAGSSSAALLEMFSELGYEPSPEVKATASHLEGQVVDLLLKPLAAAIPARDAATVASGVA
jgi:FkbM family methyltransferase